jgi:non-specific serine/threonine protein kinase
MLTIFMALPPLLKYVYSTASDEVIRRGKRIFLMQGAKLIHRDEFTNQVTFKVKNDQYNNQYNVVVSKFTDERNISLRCACPYNLGEVCRHEVAALFQLNDLIASNTFDVGNSTTKCIR